MLAAACAESEVSSEAEDLRGIAALHAADIAAVMAEDPEALMSLWSTDPIAVPPGDSMRVGRGAIESMLAAGRRGPDSPWTLVGYEQVWEEAVVMGDYAWDLGVATTRLEHTRQGTVVVSRSKLLRILRRESDGSWRVHRSVWNTDPPEVIEAP